MRWSGSTTGSSTRACHCVGSGDRSSRHSRLLAPAGQTVTNTTATGVRQMAWDFSTDPEFQKKLDWVEEFCREEIEPLGVRVPVRRAEPGSEDQGARQEPAGPDQGPGAVGDLPRRGARRPRLRPAQARSVERDHRAVPHRAADVRCGRARHRQHGDARGLRHRGAEGALAEADAQPGDVVGVLDDRTAGRLRPEPVQDARRA